MEILEVIAAVTISLIVSVAINMMWRNAQEDAKFWKRHSEEWEDLYFSCKNRANRLEEKFDGLMIDYDDLYKQVGKGSGAFPEWINIREAEPKQLQRVLVCDEQTVGDDCRVEVKIALYFDKQFLDCEFVHYWMPLPEAHPETDIDEIVTYLPF